MHCIFLFIMVTLNSFAFSDTTVYLLAVTDRFITRRSSKPSQIYITED